ncbi:exosortase family protein XrtF [Flavobacterium sp. NG2]|uniref:exosortase family protein XrtF n=1 Tax=Flavobacterium sp. NG2 TaxID=3097547 RepID=UPI002A836186|nr:exosortase family protein XrtF [Flavobacterium sp. NG2]WPR72736.1 exosortase family protein XrtF [Flavobacterium sp. NG2]
MKKYLIIYKPFLLFLAKFFLTYFLLTLVYQAYLQRYGANDIDAVTVLVAKNTTNVLDVFNVDFKIEENHSEQYIKLLYNQKYVARMVEGCNAISIVILFIAFIVSFSGKIKTTLLFILGGSVLIYTLNVLRVAILCVLLYSFPEQETILHRVFFPLFIYGFVFVLWVIWVNKYSLYAKNTIPT